MLIAQMSDAHFLPEGWLAYGKLDVAGCLERAVAHLNRLGSDAVLITGDLTSDGDAEVYAAFAAIVARLEAPYYVLTGNHDDRKLMRAQFSRGDFGADGYLPADGPLRYAVDRFPVRLVVLDTLVEGKSYGQLGAEQIAWLDERLGEAPAKPTLVALHHPPFRTGIGHLDWSMLRDADGLAEVIARHSQVERVVCGYVHRPIQRRWAGTLVQTAPGIAHQAELILGVERGGWICEPPAVLLHYWGPETGLVTHVSMIGEYGPTGRFGDQHTRVDQASR